MPTPSSSALPRAMALIELRRFNEAIELLVRLIASEPTSARPWCLLAQCHLGLNDAGRALQAAGGAATVEPGSEWAQRLRALALLQLKRRREGLAAASEAVRLSPLEPQGYVVLAEAELANRHVNGAGTAAEQARQLDPEGTAGYLTLGRVALRRHQFAKAEEHFRGALARDPENAMAMNNLGVALQRQGRKPQAIHCFAEASRLDPRLTMPRHNAVVAAKGALDAIFTLTAAFHRLRGRGQPMQRARGEEAASQELIRDLRREPGTPIRYAWFARSLATSIVGLVGITLLLISLEHLDPGERVAGGTWFAGGLTCIAACALLIRRAVTRGRRNGRR